MKKTFAIFVIALFALSVLLLGCEEQAGEAYSRFSRTSIQPTQLVRQSQCTYRESTPVCDKDVVVTRIQKTDCTTDEKRKDCSAYRLICKDGDCKAPCRAMRSDRYCDGDTIKYDYTDYRCNSREITYMNCASSGKICRDGACTDPTPTCPERHFSRCDGDDALNVTFNTDCTETINNRRTCDHGCTEIVTDLAVCNDATETPLAMACLQGTDCASGLCIEGSCRTECSSTYNGDRCSNNATRYNYAGICARGAGDVWLCDHDEVARSGGEHYADCYYSGTGALCDSDVTGPFYPNGVCVYAEGAPSTATAQCDIGEVCLEAAEYYFDCGMCSDGSLCDIDVDGSGFNATGNCTGGACIPW